MRRILNGLRWLLSKQARRTSPWFKAKGDLTLRLNYDQLDEKSLVFDIGGYLGQWTSDIFAKYQCHVHIFEPIENHIRFIKDRFKFNEKINIHHFGLGGNSGEFMMSIDNDGSSLYTKQKDCETVVIKKASDFIRENNIEYISLMKINIEGEEYALMENLIEEGLISIIGDIQIQFHSFVPEAKARMQAIWERLSDTHVLTYQYEFVWENWTRKTD